MGMSLLLGAGMVVAGPVIAGCSSGPSADDWAATEGAIGRINMEEVEEAFKKSKTVEQFEKRLNEIYEGDGIVLVRAKDEDGKRVIEGYEDLNKDNDIVPEQDDLLFTITNEKDSNDLRGNCANRHYRSSFGGGNFLFTYLIFSSLTRGGYGYYTPRSRGPANADRAGWLSELTSICGRAQRRAGPQKLRLLQPAEGQQPEYIQQPPAGS